MRLPQPPSPRTPVWDRLFAVLLIAYTLLLYTQIYVYRSFGPEFPLYYFDSAGINFETFLKSYRYTQMGWYRPTASFPYWLLQGVIDWHNLIGWRIANVFTCAITGLLVYRISLDLFPARRLAAAGAALYFVTHPDFYTGNFEVASFDFLHQIFSLLAILLYRRAIYARTARNGILLTAASWICVALGMTAKEVVIAVPGVLALLSAVRVWETKGAALRTELIRFLPFPLIWLGYWNFHLRHMPAPSPSSPYHTEFQSARTVVSFLNLALWGARIFFLVGIPSADMLPANWVDNAFGLTILAIVIWAWRRSRDSKLTLMFLLGWYSALLIVPAVTAGFMRHTSLSVPAYAIVVGVAFAELLNTIKPEQRTKAIAAALAGITVLSLWEIDRDLNQGSHSLPIRISQSLIDKPPIPPESLGTQPKIYIDDRLGLGAWAYGCFGHLFNFVYKRRDISETVLASDAALPSLLPGSNSYYLRYNDSFEWFDATDELRAVSVTPQSAEADAGSTIHFQTGLRRFGNVRWKLTGAGTISSDGQYHAPPVLAQPAVAQLIVEAGEHSPKRATARINLWPKWRDTGIGGASGWHSVEQSVHVVSGDGQLAERSDRFRIAYQSLKSDGSLSGTVKLDAPDGGSAVAGLMIRSSLAPDSAYLFAGTFGGRGCVVLWRDRNGERAQMASGAFSFRHFRVERLGNVVTGFASPDGENWMSIGSSVSVPNGQEVIGGLVVASGGGPGVNARFANVRWESGASPK